jgi:hypothetical protein
MGFQPFNWSVVIRGYWNLAILAPGRIAEKIFGLERATSVPVKVPLDVTIPCEVEHPNGTISVAAHSTQLVFNLIVKDYNALEAAMSAACNALRWLPETPVTAAGFNVNYKTDELSEGMVKMYTKDDIDRALGELDYDIATRSVARTLQHKSGKVNITVRGDTNHFEFLCNFHRDSKKNEDLIEWLSTPIEDIRGQVTQLLEKFELNVEETSDDDPE